MRVYLSGAITNNPNYENDFKRAEKNMRDMQNSSINPCFLKPNLPALSWEEYLRIDFTLIDLCDAIYMIEGWRKSKGARLEHEYARLHNKVIMYEGKRKPKRKCPLFDDFTNTEEE